MPSPEPHSTTAETPRGVAHADLRSAQSTVFSHGLMLAVVLLFFRLEKAMQLTPQPGPGELALLVLPELGFLLLFEGLWLALVGRRGVRRFWRPAYFAVHLLVLFFALLDHMWFLYTGTRLHLTLFAYSLRFFDMLVGLLATGFNPILYIRLLLVALCVLLGFRLEAKSWPRPRPGRAALAALVAGGVLLVATWWPPQRLADVWASPAVELLSLRIGLPPEQAEIAPHVRRPEEVYRAPHLEPAAGSPPLLLADPGDAAARIAGEHPNLLLLVLESTRRDATPPYADPDLAAFTPNLDRWSQRAVVVDDAYTSVTHTSKALVAILCGIYPRLAMPITEAVPGRLPVPCLPVLLEQAGYRTAFLQSALGAFENRPGLVHNMGFESGAFFEQLAAGGARRSGYLGGDDRVLAPAALSWIEGGGEQPFFLTILTSVAHHPYQIPDERAPFLGETREQYDLALAYQDRFVGDLLAALERLGHLEDTVVVILGDHGEAFGEHGRLQHDAVPYAEVVHTPMMLLGPEELIGPPRRLGGLRHQVDLMPTLLEVAGLGWQGELPGASLLSSPGHERVFSFCWYTDFCAAMRGLHGTWIYHFGRRATEFYADDDPEQLENLAGDVPQEERRAAEARILGAKFTVDRLWESLGGEAGNL